MSAPARLDLERFLEAQEPVYGRVLSELRAGRKQTHWMRFIFPQLRGLGASATSLRYAIGSLAEARAYLAHPLLGAHLLECTRIVNGIESRTAREIFGSPDDMKFHSCMTLFAATGDDPGQVFAAALHKYYGGRSDERTLELLGGPPSV